MSTPHDSAREKEIFEQALELPSAEARLGYIKDACGADAVLLARMETLLHAHEATGGFLPDNPGGTADPTISHAMAESAEKPGTVIGRYKLLQQIGEGGCGSVYMAEQEVPVRRRVALKVIKLGMDTKAVVARFEAERQALALMDHPNIAKVLDAGATDSGRPFFVMELVRGIPITRYCDENNLPMVRRLELFSQICHAIQHAHQKGIIHRDIKPSNILVTMHDGMPVPKVIDFGIAKATQGRLTDRTMFTAFEQFIGTPAYMSPEQAEMSGLDIDTRSDIYSLGVLLYELLAGRPPFDPKTFLEAGLDEIRRMIREVEPPRPSKRLSTLTDTDRTTVAKLRGTAPAQLTTVLSGDLDWIVMRCLEKDRTWRYGTPAELAADIQRHLHSEPVTARPPTAVYRFGKWVRRHKTAAATVAAVTVALMGGTAVATWQAVRATRAEKASRKEAQKSERVAGALKSIFSEIGPNVLRGEDTQLLRAMLDESTKRLQKELENEPAVLADALGSFAGAYYDLLDRGKWRELSAKRLDLIRKQAPVPLHDELDALGNLALALMENGEVNAGEQLLSEAMGKVAGLVDLQQREAMKDNLLGAQVILLGFRNDFQRARLVRQEILERKRKRLGPDHLEVADAIMDLSYAWGGFYRDSTQREAMISEAYKIRRHHLSDGDPLVAETALRLAEIYSERGRFHEAEALLRRQLAGMPKPLPPKLWKWWEGINGHLANLLTRIKDFDGALANCREQLNFARAHFPPNHDQIGISLNRLGTVLVGKGELAEAEAVTREAMTIWEKRYGSDSMQYQSGVARLARIMWERKEFTAADSLLEGVIEQATRRLGPESLLLAPYLVQQARLKSAQGDIAEAVGLRRRVLALLESTHDGKEDVAQAQLGLAGTLIAGGQCEEAEKLLLAAWSTETASDAFRYQRRRDILEALADLYGKWRKQDSAKTELATRWEKELKDFDNAQERREAGVAKP